MKHWYALYTKPRCENLVQSTLTQLGIETYIPEILSTESRSHPQKMIPFFPNYLFMRADLTQHEISHLRWTPGLRSILAFDGKPAIVDDEIVALFRRQLRRQDSGGRGSLQQFVPGDELRITEGPFQDMMAILETPPKSANQRVYVLLAVMGYRYKINLSALEKVPIEETPSISSPQKRKRRTRGRGRRINPKPEIISAS